MSTRHPFYDKVTQDTPRLVIMFKRDGEKELFQWGFIGQIPLLTLVGALIRVQAELTFKAAQECPESALVITWNNEIKKIDWYVHPSIPVDSLVGMIETVKATILATHGAKQLAAQQLILGPDGKPVRRSLHGG